MKNRIKKIRKELDLTQQEFANKIGISRGNVGAYEVGKNAPSDAVISLICREFNVNEEWLRTGQGEMFRPEPGNELDMLARKYAMSQEEYIFLEKYLKLKRPERDKVFEFLLDVSGAIRESGPEEGELDIEAEVAEYRRQLELEARRAGKLPVSKDGESEKKGLTRGT